MWLSDLFRTSPKEAGGIKETPKTDSVSAEKLNRQIKALIPGKQLQGEIVGRNGSEVRIRLSEDMVLTARLEQDVNVEEGQVLTFEVKNNGSILSLSPLFTNTATADNVMKALQMAGLPLNGTTVEMTETMMQQGMSVDAKSLQNMFREVMAYPQAEASNVVQLHQLGLPVNEANLGQMENYKALTHQLVKGMTDVLAELPATFMEIQAASGQEKAVQIYQDILQSLLPGEQTVEMEESVQDQQVPKEMAVQIENMTNVSEMTEGTAAEQKGVQTEAVRVLAPLSELETQNLIKMLSAISDKEYPALTELAQEIRQGTVEAKDVLWQLSKLPAADSALQAVLTDIFKSGEFEKLLETAVLKQWSLQPEQVVENREVKEVYERLLKQLDGVQEALRSGGATHTAAMKSAANLSQNIDFMNQLNQMYAYVQLPLKMNGGHTNGELYVYTNKKSLAKSDGSVSAFLHLDMENLGPVDVYVALQGERVSTRFTVGDDAMLDFLNEHMHILDERLQKKGYTMKCEMTVREDREEENPIDRILQTEKNTSLLAQYAFDVRA